MIKAKTILPSGEPSTPEPAAPAEPQALHPEVCSEYDEDIYNEYPDQIICVAFSPRVGSSLLGFGLSSSGLIPCCAEYFHPHRIDDFRQRWAYSSRQEYLHQLMRHRTNPSGIFAVQTPFCFFADYADLFAPDKLYFIHIERQNKIKQAISWFKAVKFGVWAGEASPCYEGSQDSYDFNEILRIIREALRENQCWLDFYKQRSKKYPFDQTIPHQYVIYEDFSKNYSQTLAQLISDALQREVRPEEIPPPTLGVQSDDLSDYFYQRFLEDAQKKGLDTSPWISTSMQTLPGNSRVFNQRSVDDSLKIEAVIAEAQPGGAETLFKYLPKHPQVRVGLKKEVHFFDDEKMNWNDPDYDSYHRCFGPKLPGTVYLDATPSSAFGPSAPERMKQYNHRMKIITIFRDPIKRLFAEHSLRRLTKAGGLSFAESIRAERRGPDSSSDRSPAQSGGYIDKGMYSRQVERLRSLFPREQLLFLKGEDLDRDPCQALRPVTDFLGLEPFDDGFRQLYLNRPEGEREDLPEERPTLEDIDYLTEFFRPDVERFAYLTGLNVSDWLTESQYAGWVNNGGPPLEDTHRQEHISPNGPDQPRKNKFTPYVLKSKS